MSSKKFGLYEKLSADDIKESSDYIDYFTSFLVCCVLKMLSLIESVPSSRDCGLYELPSSLSFSNNNGLFNVNFLSGTN